MLRGVSKEGALTFSREKVKKESHVIIYGLLPIDLFPKLTEETKVNWTYLLLENTKFI